MEHSFDIDIAKQYGIPAAVLLKHLHFWIEKNRANESNFFDGHYWTFNSRKAFADLFPYMSARQIDYAMQKLIDDDLVITGNYNKVAYDRTLWYAITKKGYSILQNCKMENTISENGKPENVKPIPDINTDKKTNINTDKERKTTTASYESILSEVENKELRELYFEYIKMRKMIKSPLTDRALKMLIKKVETLEPDDLDRRKQLLENAIMNNWKSVYPLKDDLPRSTKRKKRVAETRESQEAFETSWRIIEQELAETEKPKNEHDSFMDQLKAMYDTKEG